MAYTAPTTRSTGYIVTASVWNTDLVNNIIDLHAGNQLALTVTNAPTRTTGTLQIGYNSGSGGQYYSGTGSHYFRDETGPAYQALYGSAFNVTSDERLKQNIETIAGALEKIEKLRPVSFEWKADGSPSMGLIAQEVREVFPEAVTEAVGSDGEESTLAVNYVSLIGPLLSAVQELSARVAELEAQAV